MREQSGQPDCATAPWTDRSCLQKQYRTDVNLAARQSIYAYARPRIDLPAVVLDLAAVVGDEVVADIGCGNGAYLAELSRRGHAGLVLGADLSEGMLGAARGRAPSARLVAGDAEALPVHDGAADVTLAMHMLYHVGDKRAAVRELRRITRPGGRLLVVLNGRAHLLELRQAVSACLRGTPDGQSAIVAESLDLDAGADLLASEFASVVRHDFTGELFVGGLEPISAYVRSMVVAQDLPRPDDLAAAVTARISASGERGFRIRTHSGCLVCT